MNNQETLVIQEMEKNLDRRCSFTMEDGTVKSGVITGVSNTEHYTVSIPRNDYQWPWLVRREAIQFK